MNSEDPPWRAPRIHGELLELGFNGVAERVIGSIRHESGDRVIVLGKVPLRQNPKSNTRYHNEIRTRQALNKDAPVPRYIQRTGNVKSHDILVDFIIAAPELGFSIHTAVVAGRKYCSLISG
jgi:hypothetical protein